MADRYAPLPTTPGSVLKPDAAGDEGADAAALLEELSVFAANTEWTSQESKKAVISGDAAIDPELREEIVGAIVQEAAEAQLACEGLGAAMLGGTTEGQTFQPRAV